MGEKIKDRMTKEMLTAIEVNLAVSKVTRFYDEWANRRGESYYVSCVFYMLRVHELKYQSELVEWFGAPKQTINTVVADLASSGYLTLETDPKDRRRKIIKLTKKGEEYADLIVWPLKNCEEDAVARMDMGRLLEAAAILVEYGARLSESLEKHIEDGKKDFL